MLRTLGTLVMSCSTCARTRSSATSPVISTWPVDGMKVLVCRARAVPMVVVATCVTVVPETSNSSAVLLMLAP